MENLKSDRSFYIESDDNDEDVAGKDGNDSDSSDEASSVASQEPKNRPSSHNISWPQSYRQSMDMYSSVPSPSIGFLGTPSLSKLSGSFLSSTLTRRHTPETLPLLPTTTTSDVEQVEQQVRRSSHSLLPPLPEEKVGPAQKPSNTFHEEPVSRQCSYGQAVLNATGLATASCRYSCQRGCQASHVAAIGDWNSDEFLSPIVITWPNNWLMGSACQQKRQGFSNENSDSSDTRR
ncbi:hypothetical protein Syun_000854 [Stephania yunnanensis]|uniref:Uncharacterized protein n=1 Tax=Stephania yunnanensis TaxID=152371 RepID=A0AAP0Q762_9MAGN